MIWTSVVPAGSSADGSRAKENRKSTSVIFRIFGGNPFQKRLQKKSAVRLLFLPLILPVKIAKSIQIVFDVLVLTIQPVSYLIFLQRQFVFSHLFICHCQIVMCHHIIRIELDRFSPSIYCFVPVIVLCGANTVFELTLHLF